MARPSLLRGSVVKGEWQWAKESAAIVQSLVKVLSMGAYKREAARHAGISEGTINNWTERGAAERRHQAKGKKPRKRESAYLEFLLVIEKAQADAQISDLALITKAAQKGAWQAAAWKLERRNPSKWGRQRIEAEIKGGLVVEGVDWFEQKIDAAKAFKDSDE
jgi:transposase